LEEYIHIVAQVKIEMLHDVLKSDKWIYPLRLAIIDIKKKKNRSRDWKNALKKGYWQGYRSEKTYGGPTVVNSEELTVTSHRQASQPLGSYCRLRRLLPGPKLVGVIYSTSFHYVPSAQSTHFVQDRASSTPLKLVRGSTPKPPAYFSRGVFA
jgi:hypothetical protein